MKSPLQIGAAVLATVFVLSACTNLGNNNAAKLESPTMSVLSEGRITIYLLATYLGKAPSVLLNGRLWI